MALSDRPVKLAAAGSTGTGRFSAAHGFDYSEKIGVEFVVEAIGATPTLSFTIQGLKLGGDATVATDWVDIEYVDIDSATAVSKAAIVVTTTGRTVKFVDGLDKRVFDGIAVNVSANTNVTFHANAYSRERI